ncbi:phosphoribosylpyrophosphate synthetase [Pedobacter sp. ASV1-7]|uniref:phosphoribosylpyrophosphate synthetase n=1 Tax=Pedobacter sp. ASV1-7 TaxID=3145237 RepID=UPI0032E8B220
MNPMTTVSEILNKLKNEGYTVDFNLKENCLECQGNYLQLMPGEFEVDRTFRFEGLSDPADEAIIYAISSEKHGIKGTLINGYGIYSDNIVDEMVKALNISKNDPEIM